MKNFASFLFDIRNKSGLSQAKFAKILNLPQRTYASYEKGSTKPSIKLFLALEKNGYDVSDFVEGSLTKLLADILVANKISKEELEQADPETDIADYMNTKKEKPEEFFNMYKTTNSIQSDTKNKQEQNVFFVPLLDQKLSAGKGALLPENDLQKIMIQAPSYLSHYGENIAALSVDGDSMEPTLSRGDMVICDSCGWSGEGVYAVRMGGSGFVKRITKRPGKVVVISDNPKYPIQEESEESQDIELIGRVHCAIKKME